MSWHACGGQKTTSGVSFLLPHVVLGLNSGQVWQQVLYLSSISLNSDGFIKVPFTYPIKEPVLGVEPKASHMLGQSSTTNL